MDIFEMICHTCNKEREKLFNIHTEPSDSNTPSIIEMLEFSANITLDTTNKYPKYICYNCIKKLEITYKFLKRFHLAHKEFLVIQAKHTITNSIKTEDSERKYNIYSTDNCTIEAVTMTQNRDGNSEEVVLKKRKMDNSDYIISVGHPATMATNQSNEQTIVKTELISSTNNKITCNKCPKAFYTKLALNLHMKIHHR